MEEHGRVDGRIYLDCVEWLEMDSVGYQQMKTDTVEDSDSSKDVGGGCLVDGSAYHHGVSCWDTSIFGTVSMGFSPSIAIAYYNHLRCTTIY
jgi:hypothetical protein